MTEHKSQNQQIFNDQIEIETKWRDDGPSVAYLQNILHGHTAVLCAPDVKFNAALRKQFININFEMCVCVWAAVR